jgi:hypothetical protein
MRGTTMSRRDLRLAVICPLLLVALSVSCSGGRRPVYRVGGEVFFEGKPTPGALVILHPVNDPDPNAPPAIGRVRADGSFTPTTYTTDDGAPAGEYAVTVTWVKEQDNQDAPKEAQRDPKNLLPERYGKVATSGLRVRIHEGPNHLAPFLLTRK